MDFKYNLFLLFIWLHIYRESGKIAGWIENICFFSSINIYCFITTCVFYVLLFVVDLIAIIF